MALTFFKETKIIQVDSPSTTVTVQELIDAIRDYEDNLDYMDIGHIANASGKDDIGGGIKTAITLRLINDWRVAFEDRAGPGFTSCLINGGNLVATNSFNNNPLGPSAFCNVTIAQAASATLDSTILADLAKVRKAHTNRHQITGNQFIIYDDDNTTPLFTFDLKDSGGSPTEDNPKERTVV